MAAPPQGPNCTYQPATIEASPDGITPIQRAVSAPDDHSGTFTFAIGQGGGGFVEVWNTRYGSGNVTDNPAFTMLVQISSGASERINYVAGQNLIVKNFKTSKVDYTFTYVGE